jgi:O-antigen/teichoic acid export membrane protein
MVGSLPILTFRTPALITMERSLVYGRIVVVELLDAGVYVAWAVTTVAIGWGVWGLATAVVVRALVGTVVLVCVSPPRVLKPKLSWARLRPILGFGARFQAIGAVNVTRDQGLNFAVAAVGGLTVLGLWTLVYRVLQTLLLVFQGLWRVSFPAMSRLIEAGEDPRPIIERSVGIVALGSGVFLATLVGCGPALIPAVLGERWSEAAEILPGACLGLMIVGPVSVSVAGYLFAKGDASTALRGAILHTFAQFAVVLPLLPSLGASALGLGGVAAGVVEATVLGRRASLRSGARIISPLSVPLAAAIGSAAAGWALASSSPPTLGLAALSGLLACGSYLAVVGLLRRELFRDALRLLRGGLRRAQ